MQPRSNHTPGSRATSSVRQLAGSNRREALDKLVDDLSSTSRAVDALIAKVKADLTQDPSPALEVATTSEPQVVVGVSSVSTPGKRRRPRSAPRSLAAVSGERLDVIGGQELKDHWRRWIEVNGPFDWFATFTFKPPRDSFKKDVTVERAHRMFRRWIARLSAAVNADEE